MSNNSPSRFHCCRWINSILIAQFLCGFAWAQTTGGLPPVRKLERVPSNHAPPLQQPQSKQRSQNFNVLDQHVSFTNPDGYCTLGTSQREVELLVTVRQSLSEDVRLVHAAARCAELDSYKSGQRENLDHWMQIQVLGPQGNFKRLEVGREAFLNGISKSTTKLDASALKSRINSHLKELDINLTTVAVNQIGRDGNAYYMSIRATLKFPGGSKLVTGLGGVTLLNALPLAVLIYESTGNSESRDFLPVVLQQAFNSLLSEN